MKQIVLKSVLAVVFCSFVAVSCTKDKQDQYQDGNMTYLPISDIEVHPLGDVISVSYTSEGSWEAVITSDETGWISLDKSGSAGTTYMEITVDPCLDHDRTATISFVRGELVLDSFVIVQNKAVIDVTDNKLEYILKWDKSASEREIVVTSNIQWKVSLDNTTNFSFTSDLSGIQGAILDEFETKRIPLGFKALSNNLNRSEKRYAEITIKPVKLDADDKLIEFAENDPVNSLTKTIRISQDFLIFAVEDNNGNEITSSSSYLKDFSELGNYCRENYYSETSELPETDFVRDFKVTLEEGYRWKDNLADLEREGYVSVSRYEHNPQTNADDAARRDVQTDITLTWEKPNQSTAPLNKDIRFWIVDESGKEIDGAEIVIPISQKAYELDFTYDSFTNVSSYDKAVANPGETVRFRLNTNGPWNLTGKIPDWMQVSPQTGFGDTEITVAVPEQNLEFNPKSYSDGALAISSPLNELNMPVNVQQKAFRFNVDYKDTTPEIGISRMDTKSYELVVTSDGPWSLELEDVKSTGSWLAVYNIKAVEENGKVKYYGEACENLSVSVAATEYNTTSTSPADDRSKMLKFRSTLHSEDDWGTEGNHIRKLPFIQQSLRTQILDSNRENDFTVTPSFAAYKTSGMKETFYVNCSAPWKLSATSGNRAVDWVYFEDSDGNVITGGDGKEYMPVTMVVETNTANSDRSAAIKVTVTVGSSSKEISLGSLIQDKFVFDITYDQISEFEALNTASVSINVASTPEAGWTLSCDEWLKPDTKAGNGSKSVTLTPEYNSDGSRTGKVKITSSVSGVTKEVSFRQAAYEFDNSNVTLTQFDELLSKATSQNVKVKCTGEWIIDNIPSWMKVTLNGNAIAGGKGDQTLSFTTAETNPLLDKREATIYIKSKDFPDKHSKAVKVSQNKYTWTVTGMDKDILQEELYDGTSKIGVTSSGDWVAEIESDYSGFVSVSPDKGTGNKTKVTTATLQFTANYTKEVRKAKLTVRSKDYNNADGKNLVKSINIEQKAYVFNAPVENITFESAASSKTIEGFECSGEFKISTLPDWLEVSIKSGKLTVSAKENTDKERSHSVTIESEHISKNADLKAVFTVTQKPVKKDK